MIKILSWKPTGEIHTNLTLEECRRELKTPENLFWVNIYDSSNAESTDVLDGVFNFHPLAIADALEETHIPKIDDWHDYISVVIRVIDPIVDSDSEMVTQEVDIFIGKNFIVTYHFDESNTIQRALEVAQRDERSLARGPVYLLYLLLDETASNFILNTDRLETELNDIEDQLFNNPDPSLLEDIFALKRSVLHLRQSISPMREVLNRLARGDYEILGHNPSMYFQDIYDHFLRLHEMTENLRDLAGSTLEIFLSVVNNRMNSIMKTLTVITTLFMPISFVAGFFGMNFFKPSAGFDAWTSSPIFLIAMLVMIAFPTLMLLYILRKGWMK